MRKPTLLDRISRKLIVCPTCYEKGNIEFLGEIGDNGELVIERKKTLKKDKLTNTKSFSRKLTTIIGDNFTVFCGECSEPVYIKKGGVDESPNNRIQRFHRFSITQTTIGTGLGSQTA